MRLSYFLLGLLFVVCSFAYTFRVTNSYPYDSDFARDLSDISSIAVGDLRLLGPKLSFGGIHAGPYYYYLFVPFAKLPWPAPESILVANALLFAIGVTGSASLLFIPRSKSFWTSLLFISWIATSYFFIYSARGPGNAFSYVPLLLFLLLAFEWMFKRNSWRWWLAYGLGWGIVINFHLIVGLVAASLFIAWYLFTMRHLPGRQQLLLGGVFWVGVSLAFAPFVLFEVTHNYVQLRNTFIDKSYMAFTTNQNLTNPLRTSENPLENSWLLLQHIQPWLGLNVLGLLLIIGWSVSRPFSKEETAAARIVGLAALISFGLLVTLARSQLVFHYFFPFILITQVALFWLLEKARWASIIFGGLVIVNLLRFPMSLYLPAARQITEFRGFTNQLATSKLIKPIQTQPFSVYVTRETSLAPLGWEYRYLLSTYGIQAVDPSAYAQAQKLLWIAELPVDPERVDSWELREFGPRQLVESTQIGSRTIYLFAKK